MLIVATHSTFEVTFVIAIVGGLFKCITKNHPCTRAAAASEITTTFSESDNHRGTAPVERVLIAEIHDRGEAGKHVTKAGITKSGRRNDYSTRDAFNALYRYRWRS